MKIINTPCQLTEITVLDYLVSNPIIITGLLAVIAAIYAVLVNKRMNQKKNAIDVVWGLKNDAEYVKSCTMLNVFNNYNISFSIDNKDGELNLVDASKNVVDNHILFNLTSFGELVISEESYHSEFLYLLMTLEDLAIGIDNKIFDEQILKDRLIKEVCSAKEILDIFIVHLQNDIPSPQSFPAYLKLAARWRNDYELMTKPKKVSTEPHNHQQT